MIETDRLLIRRFKVSDYNDLYEYLSNPVTYLFEPGKPVTLSEAKVLMEQWRREYNQIRPHSSLGYRSPAPEAIIPVTLTRRVVSFMEVGHQSE